MQRKGDRRSIGRRGGDRRAVDVGGRAFTMYKFRTMTVNAETNGAVWATKNDARVTPIGGVLRGTRLDEIPQLVNVLKGDMNIVGPRPERPSIFMQLRKEIDRYQMRQRAKPGITGWAQINQNYDTSIDDVRRKVEYDLAYIERRLGRRGHAHHGQDAAGDVLPEGRALRHTVHRSERPRAARGVPHSFPHPVSPRAERVSGSLEHSRPRVQYRRR